MRNFLGISWTISEESLSRGTGSDRNADGSQSYNFAARLREGFPGNPSGLTIPQVHDFTEVGEKCRAIPIL